MGLVGKVLEHIFSPYAAEKKFNTRLGRVLEYLQNGVLDGVPTRQVPSLERVLNSPAGDNFPLIRELYASMNQKEVSWKGKNVYGSFLVNDMAFDYISYAKGKPVGAWVRKLTYGERKQTIRYGFKIHAPKNYVETLLIYTSNVRSRNSRELRFDEDWHIRGKIKLYLCNYAEQLTRELDRLMRTNSEAWDQQDADKKAALNAHKRGIEKKLFSSK